MFDSFITKLLILKRVSVSRYFWVSFVSPILWTNYRFGWEKVPLGMNESNCGFGCVVNNVTSLTQTDKIKIINTFKWWKQTIVLPCQWKISYNSASDIAPLEGTLLVPETLVYTWAVPLLYIKLDTKCNKINKKNLLWSSLEILYDFEKPEFILSAT